jgi:TRAP-type mannitol/chloroaromatic compound transport system permease small subunit
MNKFITIIDHISTWVGKTFAWCILILMAVVCYEVFMRYVMRSPTGWAYDTSYILYGTMFMMAGAYTLSRDGHVRADVVSRLLPNRLKAVLDIFLYLIFFFPGVLALFWMGWDFAAASWRIGERSPYSPAGPPLYHFKSVIPLCAFFLIIQGVAEFTRCIVVLRTGEWPSRLDDVKELEEVLPVDLEAQKEYAATDDKNIEENR